MKRKYIRPAITVINIEALQPWTMSVLTTEKNVRQYDGDAYHKNPDAGSASEFTGGHNDISPINEDDIFNDD